jgi:hypothetical protein
VRRAYIVLLALIALLGAACEVDADLAIDVNEDGSGTVTARVALDAAAVRAAEVGGAKVEDAVRLGDLVDAGWTARWRRTRAGGAVLTVRKGFARAEDASSLVAELNGKAGPIRDVTVQRNASTFSTGWSVRGVADRESLQTGVTSDAALVERLSGQRVDVAALDQRLILKVQDALRLRISTDLPNAGAETVRVPAGKRVAFGQESSATAYGRLVLLLAGIAVAVVAVVIFVAGERRDRRRPHRSVRRT